MLLNAILKKYEIETMNNFFMSYEEKIFFVEKKNMDSKKI